MKPHLSIQLSFAANMLLYLSPQHKTKHHLGGGCRKREREIEREQWETFWRASRTLRGHSQAKKVQSPQKRK